jgi:hypothetical protein
MVKNFKSKKNLLKFDFNNQNKIINYFILVVFKKFKKFERK